MTTEEFFLSHAVTGSTPDSCWSWTGYSYRGRAQMKVKGRTMNAAKVSLMICGVGIPPGAHVCHTCDNPQCTNPRHLYVGTPATNTQDKVARGRQSRLPGERNGRARLTREQVEEIRRTSVRGRQRELARLYQVSESTIRKIINGLIWTSEMDTT